MNNRCEDFFKKIHGENGKTFFIDAKLMNSFAAVNAYTNIGFKIAYFLWIMRGSNKLSQLNYYSRHVNSMTDDGETLRGAYGPRLRYWVGSDQLQEAINKNIDIDDPEDMVKPKGVDQIFKMYNDLANDMDSTCCSIFDPSIDFDNTNNIPDLMNIIFNKHKTLDMNIVFNNVCMNGQFLNDVFFCNVLHKCFSNLLSVELGSLNCFINHGYCVSSYCSAQDLETVSFPLDKDVGEFHENLFNLFGYEKHLRCLIDDISIVHPKVSIIDAIEVLNNKFLSKITNNYWSDFGYTLLCYVLLKYCSENENYMEYYNKMKKKIVGSFLDELNLYEGALNEEF